jgi:penicillin G amidase
MRKIIFWVFSLSFLFIALYPFSGIPRIGPFFNFSSGFIQINSGLTEQSLTINSGRFDAEILVDSIGIPHIYSDTDESASFALGYMHARDRYFQMELIIRMVQGKLGELLGYRKEILQSDIFWRSFQFEEDAKKLYKQKRSDQLIEIINSYSDGVNHYLVQMNLSDKPEEYFLLDTKPRKWEKHYSLMLVKYMAYLLSFKKNDIYLQKVFNDLPKEIIEAFYPLQEPFINAVIPEKNERFTKNLTYKKIKMNDATGFLDKDDYDELENDQIIGSNNWVVSGSKTISGSVILANDMHLKLSLPGPWYEAQISTKNKNVYGQTIPASPFVIAGFNGTIAWGITNAHWDLVDYYKVDYIDSSRKKYYLGKESLDIKLKTEVISFKNKADTVIEVRETKLGPIIEIEGDEFAVRWTAKNDATDPAAFYRLEKAKNWNDFKEAFKEYKSPPQNIVYADINGNIGLYTVGNMPLKNIKNLRGVLRSSEISENEFEYIPFEELPHIYNPAKGFIQSANQRQIFQL